MKHRRSGLTITQWGGMGVGLLVLLLMWNNHLTLQYHHRGKLAAARDTQQRERAGDADGCPPPSGDAATWRTLHPVFPMSAEAVQRELSGASQAWGVPNPDVAVETFALRAPPPGSDGGSSVLDVTATQSLPTIAAVLQRQYGFVRMSLSLYQRKLSRTNFEWFSMSFQQPGVMKATNASCDLCTHGGLNGAEAVNASHLAQALNHIVGWQLLRTGSPRLLYLHSVLSPSFCAELIAMASRTLQRSTVMFDRPDGKTEGAHEVHQVRTSSGTFLTSHAERFAAANAALRVAAAYALGVPESYLEPTQILRYRVGEYYVPHLDYFELDGMHRGGQRAATVLVWLNDVECGGETAFPVPKVQLSPVRGNGVVFFNVKGGAGMVPDPASLHAGQPPRGSNRSDSVKWVAILWAHPSAYNNA